MLCRVGRGLWAKSLSWLTVEQGPASDTSPHTAEFHGATWGRALSLGPLWTPDLEGSKGGAEGAARCSALTRT